MGDIRAGCSLVVTIVQVYQSDSIALLLVIFASLKNLGICNVLHIWHIRAIPTYGVYRLYDTHYEKSQNINFLALIRSLYV